ncbi:sensor histidine kinase [Clostridium rectalis]|uniref:sensor histidine kinase n=1 Tax=Clostridium rectalis TaxID=2040295 RepID=UPI000F63914F|nr:HAMP domain-containing sensor histidine kinase [Clostridium rectalis]
MYLLAIILFIILMFIVSILMCVKLLGYKKEIRNITNQISEFKEKNTCKKINTEIWDKDIEKLALRINEYFEHYKRNEQEKVVFENKLKEGIANMSHDLRTPLTSIIGYLKLLENNQIDKKEALTILKNKTNKLNVLINDFFQLSSIESEDYDLHMTKLNITKIVSDEILSFYEAFESKGIIPRINILDKPTFIIGHKDSLERIIENLVSNVLKYADKDIEINLKECNDKVIFIISNISKRTKKEDVPYIFDRFFMADKVRKGQGVGLGLPIAKCLMEKMHGNITADYKENKFSIICSFKCIK